MEIDVVIATFNRADILKETVSNVLEMAVGINKLYIIDNASNDHTRSVIQSFKSDKVVAVFNDKNLGAAGGKNIGLRMSRADIIIVIDDDAIFDCNNPVKHILEIFSNNRDVGLIQFKIINFQTRQVLRYEFPGNSPEIDQNKSFDIGYFIGAGHAIRKLMLEDVGYYPDDFGLYAHEEVDLSYRAINHGYKMRYEPVVAVLHKKAPGGRMPEKAVLHQLLLNRLIMTRRYLPAPYSIVNNFLWILKTLINSKSPILIIKVIKEYWIKRANIRRDVLSSTALRYMRKNNGRLFR